MNTSRLSILSIFFFPGAYGLPNCNELIMVSKLIEI